MWEGCGAQILMLTLALASEKSEALERVSMAPNACNMETPRPDH